MKNGKLIIFSAPSGAGKSTIVKHLLLKYPELSFSISATTRPIRMGEQKNVHYYYLSKDEFMEKVKQNAFVEYEEVYQGTFYGTLHSEIERIWAQGKTVVFDIDVKGALSLKKIFGEQALAVFIQVPSLEELEKRLRERKTDSLESLEKRIQKARYEMEYAQEFDVRLMNDELQRTLTQAEQIVSSFLYVEK